MLPGFLSRNSSLNVWTGLKKMSTHNNPYPLRGNVRLLIVLGLTLLFAVPALILKAVRTVSASIASPASPQAQADFVRIVRLTANDVVYSSTTKMLYASVPSSAGSAGNSIATIDPATGVISQSIFIGSEPNRLALADDGTTL